MQPTEDKHPESPCKFTDACPSCDLKGPHAVWQPPTSGLPHTTSEETEDWYKGQNDWLELVTSGAEEVQSGWLRPSGRVTQGLLVRGLAS